MSSITCSGTFDILIYVSILLVLLFGYFTKKTYSTWKKLGVKELPPLPIFGNIAPVIFGKIPLADFINNTYRYAKDEKVLGFHVFNKPYLMVRDPELIKHILVKDFHNFSNKILSGDDRDVLGSSNLFLAKNPPWRHIRHKLTPVFTTGKLKKMFDLMMEIKQDFENYLENLHISDKTWKPIEIKEITAKLMTDIIGITAFGMNFNSLKDPDAEFRKYGKKIFRSTYKRYFQMLAIFFIPSLRPYTNPKFFDDKGTEFLRDTFWDVINERSKTGIKRYDLIDLLIEIKTNQENDNSDDYKLEGDALVAQAAVFFTGGFETSSTTVSFALYELAKNPDIQTKLRKEILHGIEQTNNKITYDLVMTLPYLNMVVHEALRMYPVLAWLDRLPENDYEFPGTNITVKKGIPLILPMQAMHMDPHYFPNPEKFDPERFSEENKNSIIPFSYYPFGEGPRHCIGSRLGLLQSKLALILFLSNFEISPCKETLIPMKFDNKNVLCHSLGDLCLNFKKCST